MAVVSEGRGVICGYLERAQSVSGGGGWQELLLVCGQCVDRLEGGDTGILMGSPDCGWQELQLVCGQCVDRLEQGDTGILIGYPDCGW